MALRESARKSRESSIERSLNLGLKHIQRGHLCLVIGIIFAFFAYLEISNALICHMGKEERR